MVSSELLETTRQIGNGMATADRTCVITSSSRTLTTEERMQPGDGRAPEAPLLAVLQSFSREHHVLDMAALAKDAGTVVSAVMLGAVAASGLFPFSRADYEAVVGEGASSQSAASLRGFAKAYTLVAAPRAQAALVGKLLSKEEHESTDPPGLPADLAQNFPVAVHAMLALGHARLLDYQGAAYAGLYVQRLAQVLAAELAADPTELNAYATTREMARWLALWMAFDDIVRVADLKSRASRWQRVKGEVKASQEDLIQLYDHFKPGIPEFAALLPPGLAQRLTAWDRRRVMQGKLPWALPLKVGTHTAFGMLSLRVLASLKWLRVRGSRFHIEQTMIDQWLAGVVEGTRRAWQLGHEVALCGRLIKGYGSTNERGKENLLHVLTHLAQGPDTALAARAVAAARAAALADDAGKALDATLVQHGAPARPVKAVPIRFVRRTARSTASPAQP
jgi:indolepyruvate ferredoxin oxidoreductase beta subunit